MSSNASASPRGGTGLSLQYSCELCKRRKVRCDRQQPCAGCVRAGVECVTSSRAPYRRRRNKKAEGSPSQETPQETPKPVPQGVSERRQAAPMFGEHLWNGLHDEFRDPRTKDTPINEVEEEQTPSLDPSTFIMGTTGLPLSDIQDIYPPPAHAFILWQTFLQNVNPLSKVIYAPMVQEYVVEATAGLSSIPKPVIALLLAIYAAAIASLKDQECQTKLGQTKKILLAKSLAAAQQALAAAAFVRSSSLVVLQAYSIYLLAAQQIYDAQTMWILTGMALRMGQRLDLDRIDTPDGTFFEIQMRRRIWAQLALLDGKTGQAIGKTPPLLYKDLPLPANLNDADISPDMAGSPPIVDRPTEMIFVLMRYEVGKFLIANVKTLNNPATSIAERDRLIDGLERIFEDGYMKHCEPNIALHQIAAGGARSAICKMRLMAHHPTQYPDKGKSMPQSEHDLLFAASLEMNQIHVRAYHEKAVEKFMWHIDNYFPVDALVFQLIESQYQPPTAPLTEKGWEIIAETFRHRPQMMDDEDNEFYSAVRQLTLRAWGARESAMRRQGLGALAPTPFIIKLREVAQRPRSAEQNSLTSSNEVSQGLPSSAIVPVFPDSYPTPNTETESFGYQMSNHLFPGLEGMGWESWDYWDDLMQMQLPPQ